MLTKLNELNEMCMMKTEEIEKLKYVALQTQNTIVEKETNHERVGLFTSFSFLEFIPSLYS